MYWLEKAAEKRTEFIGLQRTHHPDARALPFNLKKSQGGALTADTTAPATSRRSLSDRVLPLSVIMRLTRAQELPRKAGGVFSTIVLKRGDKEVEANPPVPDSTAKYLAELQLAQVGGRSSLFFFSSRS